MGKSRDKVCVVCGTKFHDTSKTNTRSTCCQECSKALERKNSLKTYNKTKKSKERTVVCEWCHKEFTTTKHNKRFCCKEHQLKWRYAYNNEKKRRKNPKFCEVCGKEITEAYRRKTCCSKCEQIYNHRRLSERQRKEQLKLEMFENEMTPTRAYLAHLWHECGDDIATISSIISVPPEKIKIAINDGTSVEQKYTIAYGTPPTVDLLKTLEYQRSKRNGTPLRDYDGAKTSNEHLA